MIYVKVCHDDDDDDDALSAVTATQCRVVVVVVVVVCTPMGVVCGRSDRRTRFTHS